MIEPCPHQCRGCGSRFDHTKLEEEDCPFAFWSGHCKDCRQNRRY